MRRFHLAALLLALAFLGCARLDVLDPVPVPPAPGPVDPVPPQPDPVDPNVPAPPAAPWEAVLRVQKGLTMAEVRAVLGVDPAYSSVDATNGVVLSDYRIVDDAGAKQYLSVTFKAGVVDQRVRIPRAR